ncbi:FadR/GntR family transcriptional regulator [Domibacillus sp. DTU_2020_1001157_1_SI_ALB_TIR_016]|uniref:FadR/GntR family transcriptional regulator n=1 Tax=Domibacillus sp. DTU_2020_1001157_1_SI_ALB_TIR_016 TaxID=3077789 RepID=UPI0028EF4668|nr:FadR/GntR family transcriptional regulator [Domibacillus sp. DTU_2020_1001157_1_SI_ALB_TIR_016]WNS78389.1 FadR/GntR family transcriptional regulator [Domibacillus sp. DTU_2020_1001157_1_SI_ALB_TIR_016]
MEESSKKLGVQSVHRSTLSKQVVEQIVQLLVSGQMKAGDKLPPEMELMEELGVSRPVLREALSALETLGVITRKTREGTFFNNKVGTHPFSVMLALATDNLPAIIEARMALELGLVTMAAEKITDEQLEKLRKTIDAIANSEDNDYGEADKEFHHIIALSANNPIVEGMIDSLLITHNKVNSLIQVRERERTVEYHKAIYAALEARDPQDAFLQMYKHLDFVRQKVLQYSSANDE